MIEHHAAVRSLDLEGSGTMRTLLRRGGYFGWLLGLWCVGTNSPAFGDLPSAAPPLPAPTGKIVRVGTAQQLQQLMPKLTSDTTVLLEKGVYKLALSVRVRAGLKNITIRGATGNPDDVQLIGLGMKAPNEGNVPHGIMVEAADNVTIADLTVKDVFFAVHCLVNRSGYGRRARMTLLCLTAILQTLGPRVSCCFPRFRRFRNPLKRSCWG